MGKKALYANSDDLQFLFDKPWTEPHERITYLTEEKATRLFNHVLCNLGDRVKGEVDYIEEDLTKQQFLPYNTLVEVQPDWSAHVFLYRRAKGGTEDRLHDKWSIGLGGHVELAPALGQLEEVLIESTLRELEEEVGFKANKHGVREQLRRTLLLSDTRTATEAVHLGMIFPVYGKKDQLGQHEVGNIDQGQWIAVEDLNAKHQAGEIQLEPWSIVALNMLVNLHRPLTTRPPIAEEITTTGFLQTEPAVEA